MLAGDSNRAERWLAHRPRLVGPGGGGCSRGDALTALALICRSGRRRRARVAARPRRRRRPGSRGSPPTWPIRHSRRSPSRRRRRRRARSDGQIKEPPGFKVEPWAHGINNARAMTWGDKGTLFVSSRVAGNVYAVVDKAVSAR